jgi:hypothetical protein
LASTSHLVIVGTALVPGGGLITARRFESKRLRSRTCTRIEQATKLTILPSGLAAV